MKNTLKGVFLSGLVLPGLGQVALKSYKRGVAMMLVVLVAFAVIVVKTTEQALAILDKIDLEGGPLDLESISNAANQAAAADGNLIVSVAVLAIVICWIAGVVDAYRTGKKMDLADRR